MTVREVVALAAEELGREDLAEAARTATGEPEGAVRALVRCYNLVENEIALDYFRLSHTELCSAVNDRVYFTSLSRAPVMIRSVSDGRGREIEYRLTDEYIALSEHVGGAQITYDYAPAEKGIADESEFKQKITARLMAFGVACEMCLSEGRYGEAAMWEGRYRDALRAANTLRRKLCMRSRRWV